MYIRENGFTVKQNAYARRSWGAKGPHKKQIALDVGYTENAAKSVVSKIESKKGYHNAMARLAADSGNVALSIMHEFKARGVKGFDNKELISSLKAISSAWSTFNDGMTKSDPDRPVDTGKNRLRTIVLNQYGTPQNASPIQSTPVTHEELERSIREVEAQESAPPASPSFEMPDLDF